MLRALKNCTRCRLSMIQCTQPKEWIGTQASVVRRHRSTKSGKPHSYWNHILEDLEPFKRPQPQSRHPPQPQRVPTQFSRLEESSSKASRGHHSDYVPFSQKTGNVPEIALSDVVSYFEDNVYFWATSHRSKDRLISFGIPSQDAQKLLDGFVEDVEGGLLSDPENHAYYSLERFSHPHDSESIDIIYSTIFFSWAAHSKNQVKIEEELGVDSRTTHFVQRLVKATSRPYPADEFPTARAMHRKIVMHVGPTNSGKTHHALRALAAAKTGVYAGPLRLLAHEIWDRLNTGQIVPLGVEQEPNDIGRKGNPKYVRLCNMVTGEEQRMMGPDVPLVSCTVEMMSFVHRYDVAVIDEIQMIGDSVRGGAWTNAVLGACAAEVHLCGEETAVPIVQALLRHTGDELVVKRYERLTPLVVEQQSLHTDMKNVREGDCIVTFSRSSIFGVKKRVEAETGLRCAVVYGRLPPEVRSEQAALFNDPNSGYDVMIGSDAIGMGLNLKIKRVVFEAIRKFENGGMRFLSNSSIKQIAGRAGRYGLHESQVDLGGTVTTLFPNDLPHLRHFLGIPYQPLIFALVGHYTPVLDATLSILPPGTSIQLALSAPKYTGRLPPFVRCAAYSDLDTVCSFIDDHWLHMNNEDKVTLLYAPIPWRDVKTTNIVKKMLIMHAQESHVEIARVIRGEGFMETLESVEEKMAKQEGDQSTLSSNTSTLMQLESFHKVLVSYIWMSFRNPIVYSDESVVELKDRSERVLNWTLENMSKVKRITHPGLSTSLAHTKPLAFKTKLQLKKELQEKNTPSYEKSVTPHHSNLLSVQ